MALRETGAAVWVDILRPDDDAANLLGGPLGLGPLTVEDCLEPLRMPKMDSLPAGTDGTGAFVAAFAVRLDLKEGGPRLRAQEVDLVVGPGHLVTARDEPAEEIEARLRPLLDGDTLADAERPGFALAHAALDALVDGQPPAMTRAAVLAEGLEESLDPRDDRGSLEALEVLITLRGDLSAFRRLAVAQGEVLRRLGRLAPELGGHLSDVSDNQREDVDMADAVRDYIDGAVEAYRMRRDQRSETGIRRLTVLAEASGVVCVAGSEPASLKSDGGLRQRRSVIRVRF